MAMALKLHRIGHSQTLSSKRANERDKSRSKCYDQYTGGLINSLYTAQIEAQFRWEIFKPKPIRHIRKLFNIISANRRVYMIKMQFGNKLKLRDRSRVSGTPNP